MSAAYEPPPRLQTREDDAAGALVLVACLICTALWYIAVSRFHLTNSECLELFLESAIIFFGLALLIGHFAGRREKMEENWPHPPILVPFRKDTAFIRAAGESNATVLGYNVHGEPWLWPDAVRMRHAAVAGMTGAGKTTLFENIIAQDLNRRFHGKPMPMIIFDGKGDQEFLERLLPHIEASGRLQDLRLLDPSRPGESVRYNPFYSPDDLYQEHVNFIFRSFGLQKDFFEGHQKAYLSNLVRILHYTGRVFNTYDVLVMALDEKVLQEQVALARARIASLPDISMQRRLNFELSVRMIQKSLGDRERIEKIQGLLNELVIFLEDELSVVTGSYQDLLTLDEVVERGLILFISLNSNRNKRACEALGKILLQNIELMIGKRYGRVASQRDANEPLLSVILDEISAYAYPGFTQGLQTSRGARVTFLFSFQSIPQLQTVSYAFAEEVSSAPGTKIVMQGSDEQTAQWFLKASSRILRKRRSLAVRRAGIFKTKYRETGTGSESDVRETRAREEHIKNLPVGQMEILMADVRQGMRHSHLHVRRQPRFQLEGLTPSLYPQMHGWIDSQTGANLRFREEDNRRRRRRSAASLSGMILGDQ